MSLTKEQQQVVDSKEKRLIVLSCAGSGKTTVITMRIANLWKEGVKPENMLALTFSNKAAQEMKKRICRENPTLGKKVTVKTFHAFGLELIRRYNHTLGFTDTVKITRSTDKNRIISEILNKNNLKELSGDSLHAYLRKCKSCEEFLHISSYDNVFNEYTSTMKSRNLVDMDDMIWLPIELLSHSVEVRKVISEQYRYIFVDEYQDTNEAQNKLLDLIVGKDTNICLVGDDDQAIYEWRGAKPQYIKEKANSENYSLIKLEKNFRSQQGIIDVANAIINKNKQRVSKQIKADRPVTFKPIYKRLRNVDEEAEYVADKIKELIEHEKYNPSDIAVLFRTNAQIKPVYDAIKAFDIECDRCEIDENAQYSRFVSVLQSIVDLSSVNDLGNALNFPNNCFDKFVFTDAKNAYCDEFGQDCDFSTLEWIDRLYLSDVSFENCDDFRERYGLIIQLHQAIGWTPTQVIALYLSFLEEKDYDKLYPDQYHFAIQVFDIAKEYEDAFGKVSLKDFLYHLNITLGIGDVARSTNYDGVNLLTMHRSKGLEFKVVFIVGVQTGVLPNGYYIHTTDDLESERRLLYVAITRAKDLLFFTSYKDPFGGELGHPIVTHGLMAEIPKISYSEDMEFETILEELPSVEHTPEKEEVKKQTYEIVNDVIRDTIEGSSLNIEKTDEESDISSKDIIKTKGLEDIDESIVENDNFANMLLALSKEVSIPSDKFIVIIGNTDIKTKIVQGVLKDNSFTNGQFELYDYDGKGFKLNKYFNNSRCIGIILGPEAHRIQGVDSNSLKSQLLGTPGYPYFVDLIDKHITKTSLQNALAKIKWNYVRNIKEQ